MASLSDVLLDLCLGEGIKPSLIFASSMLELVLSSDCRLNFSWILDTSPDFGLRLNMVAFVDASRSATRLATVSSVLPFADNVLRPTLVSVCMDPGDMLFGTGGDGVPVVDEGRLPDLPIVLDWRYMS